MKKEIVTNENGIIKKLNMEEKFINYLFEKGYLNIDQIIKDNVDSKDISTTTFTLLKKVTKDYNDNIK